MCAKHKGHYVLDVQTYGLLLAKQAAMLVFSLYLGSTFRTVVQTDMRPCLFFARGLYAPTLWVVSLSFQLQVWYSGIMLQLVPQRPTRSPK